mgnify:CR=1 FL=1
MFKKYNQQQNFLIPPSYDDFLWEKHEAKLLNNIIEWLNLDFLYKSYNNSKLWTTAYDPKMLLKVLFYWYMNSTFSSRKIAKKLKSDLWFMFLAWNNKPDFRTINNFRKNKWKLLEKVFVEIIYLTSELWLVKFWTFSIDWTQIYANASKHRNIDLERLQEKINWFFDEADRINEEEDEKYWDNEDEIPDELADPKKQEEAIKKAKEKYKKYKELQDKANKENNKAKENKKSLRKNINLTDSDSRFQKMKRWDTAQWYNCQIVTENQIIIWNSLKWKPWDLNTLIPTLNKIKNKFNKTPKKILADKWYGSEQNYIYLEDEKIDSYIPHIEWNKVNLEDYIYDIKSDTYEDKENNIFVFKQYVWSLKKRKKWRPRKWENLKEGDFEGKLYISKQEKTKDKFLKVTKNQKLVFKRNDDRLYSKKWKKLYKSRSNDVEAVFWNIKYNLWFERFLLRWFNWVQIEWNLINLAHNLKKIMKFQIS